MLEAVIIYYVQVKELDNQMNSDYCTADEADANGNPYIAKTVQANYIVASNGWVVD